MERGQANRSMSVTSSIRSIDLGTNNEISKDGGYEEIMALIGPLGKWQWRILPIIFLPTVYGGKLLVFNEFRSYDRVHFHFIFIV